MPTSSGGYRRPRSGEVEGAPVAVLFLASEAAGLIAGCMMHVDGRWAAL
jgi:NAD(P)-dependent dehydrogenase (short-subunit alcohol dehydrogenase family)